MVCCGLGAEEIELIVHRKSIAAAWNVQVCRECWRVMEAMLDTAAPGRQLSLLDQNRRRGVLNWFW